MTTSKISGAPQFVYSLGDVKVYATKASNIIEEDYDSKTLLINLTGRSILEPHMSGNVWVQPMARSIDKAPDWLDIEKYNKAKPGELILHWPDMSAPRLTARFWVELVDTIDREKANYNKVIVFCTGGMGRTGTALVAMEVVCGKDPHDSLVWIRDNYDEDAVETQTQLRYLANLWAAVKGASGDSVVEMQGRMSALYLDPTTKYGGWSNTPKLTSVGAGGANNGTTIVKLTALNKIRKLLDAKPLPKSGVLHRFNWYIRTEASAHDGKCRIAAVPKSYPPVSNLPKSLSKYKVYNANCPELIDNTLLILIDPKHLDGDWEGKVEGLMTTTIGGLKGEYAYLKIDAGQFKTFRDERIAGVVGVIKRGE